MRRQGSPSLSTARHMYIYLPAIEPPVPRDANDGGRGRSGSTEVLGNNRPEFEKPPTDQLIANRQSALSQEILDIPVAQGEPEVKSDSVLDDIWRKSVGGKEMGFMA